MKNVLIICGSFPPNSEVGGLRPAMFAKYLKQFGWNPWVITRSFPKNDSRYNNKMSINLDDIENQISRIEYGEADELNYLEERNIFTKSRDFFYSEYSSPPGVYFAVKEKAIELCDNHHFDLIFATSPDHWEITLGSLLSKKYNTKFVVDFRDIKEQEQGLKRTFREYLQVQRFVVRRFINTRQADLITTVSKYHAKVLSQKLYKKVDVIYNGYDHEAFYPQDVVFDDTTTFKIIYAGRILNKWYRNPEILLESVDKLIDENKIGVNDISVDFYGTEKDIMNGMLANVVNKTFVNVYDSIPFNQVNEKLNESQILLLLTNKGRKGILTTKSFEYAGVKKPILCVPGDSSELDELIRDYDLGYSIDNVDKLKLKLLEWVNAYRNGLYPSKIESNVDCFSRVNQTKELAKSFNSLFN